MYGMSMKSYSFATLWEGIAHVAKSQKNTQSKKTTKIRQSTPTQIGVVRINSQVCREFCEARVLSHNPSLNSV